ncbi:MAG: hypothetical protein AAGA99_26535 [Actinomycetota bacterium]
MSVRHDEELTDDDRRTIERWRMMLAETPGHHLTVGDVISDEAGVMFTISCPTTYPWAHPCPQCAAVVIKAAEISGESDTLHDEWREWAAA